MAEIVSEYLDTIFKVEISRGNFWLPTDNL